MRCSDGGWATYECKRGGKVWEVLNASEVFGMYTRFAAGARIMIYFAYCYFVCVCVCVCEFLWKVNECENSCVFQNILNM